MNIERIVKYAQWLVGTSLLGIVLVFVGVILEVSDVRFNVVQEEPMQTAILDPDKIENGVHVATGLIDGEGLQIVIASCTACHSAKLVTQNRANKAGWIGMIRWMQETQNLWDLGDNEELIVKYLSENYAPTEKGRRANLKNIQWYELED